MFAALETQAHAIEHQLLPVPGVQVHRLDQRSVPGIDQVGVGVWKRRQQLGRGRRGGPRGKVPQHLVTRAACHDASLLHHQHMRDARRNVLDAPREQQHPRWSREESGEHRVDQLA